MSPSARPSRQAVFLTLALACVVGVVGGATAFLLARPVETPVLPGPESADPIAATATQTEPSASGRDPLVKADSSVAKLVVKARKGGHTERAELARLIASPDRDVAYTTALQLMLQGPQVLITLKALDPPTDAARELVGKMIQSLEHLEAVQTAKAWPTLWNDKRLEAQMQAFEKVIPQDYLTEQAEEFYAAKFEGDRKRFEMGHIEQGELFLTETLLAGERVRQGKLADGDLSALLQTREVVIRAWLKDAEQSNRFAGNRWMRLRDRFDALRRL